MSPRAWCRLTVLVALLIVLSLVAPGLTKAPKGTKYAFLVACSNYKRGDFERLPGTFQEMSDFRDALIGSGFAAGNIRFLHDNKDKLDDELRFLSHKRNIVKELKLLLLLLKPEDTLVVALDGHGLHFKKEGVGYFLPSNAEFEDKDRSTMVAMDGEEGLFEKLRRCKAERKLLLVNACRDDPLAKGDFAARKGKIDSEDNAAVPKGIAALFSCKPKQRSFTYRDDSKKGKPGRSLFYHHLIEAWQGKYAAGKAVTLEHVFEEVSDRTKKDAADVLGEEQEPEVRRRYDGRWIVNEPGKEKVIQKKPKLEVRLILPDTLKAVPTKTVLRFPKGETEGIPWKVWVGVDQFRPLAAPRRPEPGDESAYMRGKPMKFMDPCFVAHRHQSKDTAYLLLVTADRSGKKVDVPLGWIDERWVVPDPVAKAHPTTGIHRKVMIVNTPESVGAGLKLFTFDEDVKAELDSGKLPATLRKKFSSVGVKLSAKPTIQVTVDSSRWTIADDGPPPQQFEVQKKGSSFIVSDSFAQAGVFDAPLATARRRTALKLFNILFIYAETPEYALVGTKPALGTDLDVVKGWIPKYRLAFWDTREGFEWNRETTPNKKRKPGAVLLSLHDAYQWEEGKPLKDKPIFLEKFDKNGLTQRYKYSDQRFLKLKWAGDKDYPEVHPKTGNRLHHVLAVGTLPGGVQIAQTGYVWQYAPGGKVAQLRPVVLLYGADVQMIVNLLEKLAGKDARLIRDVGSLKKLHVYLVEDLTGDSNLSIAEAVARKRGLKFTSPILKLNPKEINRLFSDTDLEPLKLKLARLKDLLKDQEVAYKWEIEKVKSGEEYKEPIGQGTPKKRRRYYTLPGDNVRWYWVDVEREIP